jgi:hypothetical protein
MFGLLNPISMAQKIAVAVLGVLLLAGATYHLTKVTLLNRQNAKLVATVSEQASQIAQLQFAKQSLEQANQAWSQSADRQNAQIQSLLAVQKTSTKRMAKEMEQAKKKAQLHQEEAARWKKLALSKEGAMEKELEKRFNQYLKERQQ